MCGYTEQLAGDLSLQFKLGLYLLPFLPAFFFLALEMEATTKVYT